MRLLELAPGEQRNGGETAVFLIGTALFAPWALPVLAVAWWMR